MSKYRTYIDDEGEESEFTVFLIHGHSQDWRIVERYIKEKLEFNVVVLKERYRGKHVLDKYKEAVWYDCDCAVGIMNPDDQLKSGDFLARPNVLYEIGYCQGFYDHLYWKDEIEPVVILKEKTVPLNSDLHGLEFIEFEKGRIDACFHILDEALENIYDELNNDEDNDDD
jgi:predicted nucleotide-binding protein